VHDARDYGPLKLIAVAGKAVITYEIPPAPAKGAKGPPPGPTANTVGFVYTMDLNTCSMISSQVFAKFTNKGIRSIKLATLPNPGPPGVAMLAYDNNSATGPGAADNEYLVFGDALNLGAPSTEYWKISGSG
jgi:hypothetical protein